jgi:hypothetical protein
MALLFMDGFDGGDMTIKGWAPNVNTSTGNNPATRFGTGRWGGVNSTITRIAFPAATKIFTGFSMANTYNDTAIRPYIFLCGDAGATTHLSLGMTNNGIYLYRGALATLIGQYNFGVTTNIFYNFEISATINDTTGNVVVRMNGITVISYTGDTKNAGTNSTIDAFGLGANGGMTAIIDDLYICDDSGAAPYNTFLGDVRVQTLVPNGAGSSTQFTPSTGANYTTVDELPYSSTDYVYSNTSGQRDTYTVSDLTGTPTIYAVQNNVVAKRSDAGAISLRPAIKSGASVYYGTTVALGTSDGTLTDLRTLDPNTSSTWTVSGVNALESGFEVV